jgi:two-component system response regulator DegU
VPPNVSVKLLIVDDHPLFRQGVRFALATYDDIHVAAEASSGEDALAWLTTAPPNQEPNVVLVDLNLPGMSGLEVTRQLRHQYPSVGVVMLSIYENDEQAFNALQAGAAAYRSKDINPKDLADILRRVARGEYVINDVVLEEPKVASRLLSQFRNLPKNLISSILRKLSLNDRTQAVLYALRRGWIEAPGEIRGGGGAREPEE